jgi:hypothetical protein
LKLLHGWIALPSRTKDGKALFREADFVHVESRPRLHQWTTILSETRLLDSLARAVSKGRSSFRKLRADELDLHSGFGGQVFGFLPQFIPIRLGKAWIVKDPHLTLVKIRGHSAAKQIFGRVPKISTLSQQLSIPAI